jgi:hypothetical protein
VARVKHRDQQATQHIVCPESRKAHHHIEERKHMAGHKRSEGKSASTSEDRRGRPVKSENEEEETETDPTGHERTNDF